MQRLGERAEAQTRQRLREPPLERNRQRRGLELAVLMLDGWLARFRGPGWGKKKTQQERVACHEVKTGVYYLHEQAAQTRAGRGILAEKTMVRWYGKPPKLEQRLHWEALRGGLGRAPERLVLGGREPLDLERGGRPLVWSA